MPRWNTPRVSVSATTSSSSATDHFADISGRYPAVGSSSSISVVPPCNKPYEDLRGRVVSAGSANVPGRGASHTQQDNPKNRRFPLAAGIVGRMSLSARTVLPLAFVVFLMVAPSWCSAREAPHYIELVRPADPAEAHGFFNPSDIQPQGLTQEKVFSLVPSSGGSAWGDFRERLLDNNVLNGGVNIEEEQLQPIPYTTPRKRGAIVLDKLMFALQKAIDEPGASSSSGGAPSQGFGKGRMLPSGPMDLQRRGNSDGRLYWRCYFNAVSCFRRK
ncbi:allatostatin double C [Oratosquilla oratoria]|uniref:allatostatin double C n=1 Tax=Oratosquilla oratoria TaxID=337810 RepID=UPI003F769EFC